VPVWPDSANEGDEQFSVFIAPLTLPSGATVTREASEVVKPGETVETITRIGSPSSDVQAGKQCGFGN